MVKLGQIALILAGCALGSPAVAQTAFYEPNTAEIAGRPGTIIRSEAMPEAPLGASAHRVLYRSTGLNGETIPVSGVVIVPDGRPAEAARPIVAWAHPTTGIVPRCAPSLAHFLYQQIAGLRTFIDRGYIVAATDYPGLGTSGPHPFLVGESEGRAVLDVVRAAHELIGDGVGHPTALWGHSQGGQAVLFAARLAAAYASELDIAAVAAAAPATDLGRLMKGDLGTPGGDNLTAMTLWSWSRIFGVPLAGVVDPGAIPLMNELAQVCLESPIDVWPRRELGRKLAQGFLLDPQFADHSPWRELLAANTAGTLPPAQPVFLAQGTNDDTVRPEVTLDYAHKLCGAGSRLAFLSLPGVGHGFAANEAVPTLAVWLADRFAGRPASDDCAALP